jgi:hypothetical protein
VSPDVTPYPTDAQNGMPDGPGPGEDASGPGPDARPMGEDAGGPIDAAGPGTITVGWPEPFVGGTVILSPDTMFAFRLPSLDVDGSLQAWGIVPANGSGSPIYMALYTDGGGQPEDLISWTNDAWAAEEGTYPATGTPVQAGTYWLVVVTQNELEVGGDPAQVIDFCLLSHGFDAPFESPFGTPDNCSITNAPNVFIQVATTGAPASAPAALPY